MSEVKRYVFGISRTEPGDRLTAGTVYVDEADYAALQSKLSTVQAGADRLREALAELRSCSRAKIGMEDDFACADKQMRDALAPNSPEIPDSSEQAQPSTDEKKENP